MRSQRTARFPRLTLLLCGLCLAALHASAATYFVSPTGSDKNSGASEAQAFKMVQSAVDRMKADDTLVVLDGCYTGLLKIKSGITIKAKNPRRVVFSGAEVLPGSFQKHSGNIYKIEIGQETKELFYRNEPMTWARWPNLTWSENWIGSKKWAASSKGSGPGVLKSDGFIQLAGIDLAGAYCFLRYSKGNSCYSRPVESFDGKTLHWDETDFYSVPFSGEDGRRGSPAAISKGKSKSEVRAKFFLAGALDLLDSGGEWFAKDGTLYFKTPDGKQPDSADVLIKTNDYSLHESEPVSDVSIEGVDFFATSVKLANSGNQNISFRDCQFTYIGGELLFINSMQGKKDEKPVRVEGSDILFEKCLFAGAQNTALTLVGSNCVVDNCVFAENNRHANFESRALTMRATGTYAITRNTFFNNCSDAVIIGNSDEYQETKNPQISYNHIFNAGIYNADVSGVYMPNLSQHWAECHHNWIHNCHGNGVRLDQAGEKLSVHHNVFWASKRGLNIEGYGNFNVYNNTSVLNKEPCAMTRNVVDKRKGTGDAVVSNDTTFPPITDWNILNNLVQEFVDRVGPSESGPFGESKKNGKLHPERAKHASIPITDRGAVRGNLTGFKPDVFLNGTLDGLILIPAGQSIGNVALPTAALAAQGVTDLGAYRGAYSTTGKPWVPGSDWMPYGLEVPKTMAQSEAIAKKYRSASLVPHINVTGLPDGLLSPNLYQAVVSVGDPAKKIKKKRKGRK